MNYNKSLVLVPAPQSYKKTSMRDVRIFSIIIIAQITGSQGTRQRSLPEHPTPGRIFRTCIPRWLRGERYQHFGARAYDPLSCIFMQTDPLAEKYYGFSPYAYCGGNPVNLVDPDGKEIGLSETLNFILRYPNVAPFIDYVKKGSNNISTVPVRFSTREYEDRPGQAILQ